MLYILYYIIYYILLSDFRHFRRLPEANDPRRADVRGKLPIEQIRDSLGEAPRWLLCKGTSITRIGFWGPLYYDSNKEPPK